MEKAKVFIASSGRTLTLAEKLRDELQTEFCEAWLWTEESRRRPGATIIEMLENAAEKYDFAVIILARDDVVIKESGDILKARDNCVFEAGLFVRALGRERCFLVNSVDQRDLPSDLSGIISLRFAESGNLSDRDACAEAVRKVSGEIKDSIQRMGRAVVHARLSLLSVADVFQRERPRTDGGDLHEGQVVVCDLQPVAGPEPAAQVRRNLDSGVSYLYFLYFSDDTIEKIIQALQIILVADLASTGQVADFGARVNIVKTKKDRILENLRRICSDRSLRVSLIPNVPPFSFRVHNASDLELARLYLRYRGSGFLLWTEGEIAVSIMRDISKHFLPADEGEAILFTLKQFSLDDAEELQFQNALDRGLKRYFPGLEDEVKRLCLGSKS